MQIIDLQYTPVGVCPVVHVSQFDVGRQFQLKIYDGAMPYSMPSGTTARIDGIKPDKKGFSYSDAVSVSGNVVTVTTKEQMTIMSGTVVCEIRFINAGNTIGTLNFKMEVEPSPINEDTDISETDLPEIFELATEQMHEAEAWAKGTKNGVAVTSSEPQYHNNSKYYSEQAGISATNAATSESNAATSETNASNSASAAASSANNAAINASSALASATSADHDATDAALAVSAAESAATRAETSASVLDYYTDFLIPRFIVQNNRLYVSDTSQTDFVLVNNRLYIRAS